MFLRQAGGPEMSLQNVLPLLAIPTANASNGTFNSNG